MARIARDYGYTLAERKTAGSHWQDTSRVFTTATGTPLGARHIRKMFQDVCERAGLGRDWAPRDLRHTGPSRSARPAVPVTVRGDLALVSLFPQAWSAQDDFARGPTREGRVTERHNPLS